MPPAALERVGFEPVRAQVQLPTGLTAAQIAGLRRGEKAVLHAWHQTVAGDDDGRPWIPGAVRALPLDARLRLATDDELDARWRERERRRVQTQLDYFVEGYGHVKDEDAGGPPIPFLLWPRSRDAAKKAVGARDQRELLALFETDPLLALLKARQLGITWLALHYGYHLMAFEPSTANATVLGLSQDGNYAKRLLERVRRINRLLPGFLRHPEDRETRESKTEMKLLGRGKFVSLPGTKDAPRSWQADLAICDEWAFVRNGQAGPTMRALLPMARQIIAVSSGNGPPEEEGWGQHFAQLWARANRGENDWTAVFLPTSTHPARDKAFREGERQQYDSDEDYLAEHPESPDDALIGAGKDRFFKLSHVNAAVRAGAELDALLGTDEMPPPSGEAIHLGQDWGEAGHGLVVWPLEGGGIYVPPSEVVSQGVEPGEHCVAMHHRAGELQNVDPETGRLEPPIGEERFDAAGIQSNRTFMATARARFKHQYRDGDVRSRGVPFGKFKAETAGYLRRLFKRVGEGRTTGIIAISPHNEVLLRQLRGLESGPGGVWKKADDQHGPDALVAGGQRIARVHRQLRGE